jgi:hypothetical protein
MWYGNFDCLAQCEAWDEEQSEINRETVAERVTAMIEGHPTNADE